jgi:myo-inositol-1(or 4)-monophosphatase
MTLLPSDEIEQLLDIAIKTAKKGALPLKRYWGNLKQIHHKDAAIDLVTDADKESEKAILRFLNQKRPTDGILTEETGLHQNRRTNYLWVIDPLDGTTNYTHQFPMAAVSVGLLYKNKPMIGVVYNPFMKELFYAARGFGAHFNGSHITVSHTHQLEKSLLASGFPYDRQTNPDNNYAEFCYLTHYSQGVRRGGAASLDLSYVAAGRLDGYWESGLKPWDIAAGIVIVEEAGGKVSSYENKPIVLDAGKIIASNGFIHAKMFEKLKEAKKSIVKI